MSRRRSANLADAQRMACAFCEARASALDDPSGVPICPHCAKTLQGAPSDCTTVRQRHSFLVRRTAGEVAAIKARHARNIKAGKSGSIGRDMERLKVADDAGDYAGPWGHLQALQRRGPVRQFPEGH